MVKKVILVIFVVLSTACSAAALSFLDGSLESNVELSLVGENELDIEVGSSYTEEGCVARYGSELIGYKDIEYETDGEVNVKKLGSYKISYKATADDKEISVVRTVNVVDTTPPIIEAPEKLTVYEGTTVFPVKYKATDSVDGDLTDKVQKVDFADSVTLTIADKSGNLSTKRVKVEFIKDTTPPKITLSGSNMVFVRKGAKFKDPGCSATDNCDGKVTDKVAVSGSVDTAKKGTYTLTYSLTDKAGNKAAVKRTVMVYELPKDGAPQSSSVIYLTFDDGPGPHTDKLLSILESYNVKATFFVTNQFPEYQNLIGKAHRMGHKIAVHTYSHRYENIYKSVDSYLADFNKMNEVIFKQTGEYSNIFRFPGGASNLVSANYSKGIMTKLSKLMTESGYYGYDWNVGSDDTSTSRSDRVASNVTKRLRKNRNNIVLMHDIKAHTVNAVPSIIEYGLAHGYTFSVLTESVPIYFQPIGN